MGFLALLTPCVFPMIPITVSYFTKEGEKENSSPLFSASLSQLLNDQILELENWNLRGYETKVPFYNFDGHKVWGVTAAILSEFKLILNDLT